MLSFLVGAFFTDFPRFLFKHLFCVSLFSSFSLPFSSCFSLLVCVFLLDFSFFVFFSSSFFSPFFPLFSLSCFSFFFGEEHMFLMVFGAFLSTFASPGFLSFPLFFWTKKTFVLKSLLFCPFIKMVFENVLKFDLCHTSPFVFNSCITYFSFLPRLKKYLLYVFELCFWRTSLFFCFFVLNFCSSFHSRFFVSLSCESSILFTSLFKKIKFLVLFSLFILSSFFFHSWLFLCFRMFTILSFSSCLSVFSLFCPFLGGYVLSLCFHVFTLYKWAFLTMFLIFHLCLNFFLFFGCLLFFF